MKRTRLMAALVTLALALSLAVPAAAYSPGSLVPQKRTYTVPFQDTKGTWCDGYAKTVYEAGLMDGKGAGMFDPAGSLTSAQITVIAARLHSLLHGGTGVLPAAAEGESWYGPAVTYLQNVLSEGTAAGDFVLFDLEYMDQQTGQTCDRFDFVWYLSAVLPESALAPINTIIGLPDVQDMDVLRFYNAGILTGTDQYGTFRGMDSLNRGQAAAMLARIVDPAQRMTFTPEKLVLSQALLGLAPETVLATVDGYSISAELYAYYLAQGITAAKMEHYLNFYELYPEHLEAYWADVDYQGTYSQYLLEVHGIDTALPLDWNAADKGGMSPAQKVRANTLSSVKTLAVLLNHQREYPLTATQTAELDDYVAEMATYFYGCSDALIREFLIAQTLQENLTQKFAMSPAELNRYLADNDYVYGQYLVIYRGEEGFHTSDAQAKEIAETARQHMAGHLDDAEYIEYLIGKYSDDYESAPGLISIGEYSGVTRSALNALGTDRVSQVLTEDDRYLVVLKRDPSEDSYIAAVAASIPAQAQLAQWAESAVVTTTPLYDAVDIAKAATAAAALE